MSHWKITLLSIVAFCTVLTVRPAIAVQVLTSNAVNGNQNFGGGLGMDFQVFSEIRVTELGVFDNGQDGIPSGTINAAIYSRNQNGTVNNYGDDTGTLITTISFDNASPGTLTDGYRMKTIAPAVLGPGNYTLVADGLGAPNQLLNTGGGTNVPTNNAGTALSFEGLSRFSVGTGIFPGTTDGGGSTRYHSSTFSFNVTGLELNAPIVIDNNQAGYVTNAWSEQNGPNDAFNDNQGFNSAPGNQDAFAQYNFTGLEDGIYEVFATWRQPGQINVGEAEYDLDGVLTTIVDQNSSAGGPLDDLVILGNPGGPLHDALSFQKLGELTIIDGDLTVTLSLAPGNNGFILSDAVAIRQLNVVPEPTTAALLAFGCVAVLRRRRQTA